MFFMGSKLEKLCFLKKLRVSLQLGKRCKIFNNCVQTIDIRDNDDNIVLKTSWNKKRKFDDDEGAEEYRRV